MEKKPYYVSVQAKTVMENQGDAAYELEIEATPEDIERLKTLFEYMGDFDHGTFMKSHALAFPYHLDPENDGYDTNLRAVYEMMYEWGTPETKRHIEQAGLLRLEPNNEYAKNQSP
ncbi:hypothetical protein SD70_30155 [Gordoniibacillus kamchatkensis]|uniref:Hydrolase n=1 Tax=Gordoniibacillus kamchatkensis TaxID=1590651 RepID=A0ABR5ABA5_9BACL|nr:hypothetical protein [Paenibacillus sp. VKM B-2647]KIL37870.1 hypothetical protein SD70_30155 [Paenibacillus sp. VKM B-2647]